MDAPQREAALQWQTPLQRQTLCAVIDCIIPADEWPSASTNHVDAFILKITDTDMRYWRDDLIAGLDALTADAQRIAQRPFHELPLPQQNELLASIEKDTARGPWFSMLIQLTHEGYFADRSNGANLEHASWKMIGYDPRLPPGLI